MNILRLKSKSYGAKGLHVFLIAVFFMFFFASSGYSAPCPEPRKTQKAPTEIYQKKNPLPPSPENIQAGAKLYKKALPLACVVCHGENGNGRGKLAKGLKPQPRNFTCSQTMKNIADGQLFWIIQNGSKNTGMMGYKKLNDDHIWQLIHYIRQFAG